MIIHEQVKRRIAEITDQLMAIRGLEVSIRESHQADALQLHYAASSLIQALDALAEILKEG